MSETTSIKYPETVLTEEDIVFYKTFSHGYCVPWEYTNRLYLWRMNILSITKIVISNMNPATGIYNKNIPFIRIEFISNINYYVGNVYTSANTKKTTLLSLDTLEEMFSKHEIEQLSSENKIIRRPS